MGDLKQLEEYRQLEFIEADPIPDWFGNWFAGFVDGEGHLKILKIRGCSGGFDVCISIKLRDDDIKILQKIKKILKVGTISRASNRNVRMGKAAHQYNTQDQVRWQCNKIAHLWRYVVPLLDNNPLQSKKAQDYVIWREAVALRWRMNGVSPMPMWYIKRMGQLERQIKSIRKYKKGDSE